MEIGVPLPQYGEAVTSSLIDAAIDAIERSAADSVWVGDHVALPAASSAGNPFHGEEGVPGLAADLPFYDAFVLLGYVAGRSERLRLGLSALVAPLRSPFHVARLLGSLDAISRGRLTVAVAGGWWREEFDALGLDFARRGPLTDRCIEAIEAGRAGTPARRPDGAAVGVAPYPVQQPRLPLWGGGHGPRAMERALALDGWHAGPCSPAEFAALVVDLRRRAGGELPTGFALSSRVWLPDFDPATDAGFGRDDLRRLVEQFAAAGASTLVVGVRDPDAERQLAKLRRMLSWLPA